MVRKSMIENPVPFNQFDPT